MSARAALHHAAAVLSRHCGFHYCPRGLGALAATAAKNWVPDFRPDHRYKCERHEHDERLDIAVLLAGKGLCDTVRLRRTI